LINMSLGGGPDDAAVRSAIADARAQGCLVIVANGNDYRDPVSFPASDSLALAVSAMGRLETFPSDSTAMGDIDDPRGKDPKNFVAAFSNIGPETDLIGPGVDIVSTVPGGYAPMSGTSMACPAVTGIAARLLSARPNILAMSRDRDRSDEMAKLLLRTAVKQGFGPDFEGQGRLP
jgi:subtilisin